MKTLLALSALPDDDPYPWTAAMECGDLGVAVVHLPGILDGPAPDEVTTALSGLAAAGVTALGYVSLGYATRPVGDVLTEITRWSTLAVTGVFLDHAPAGPFQLGPAALAYRTAHRLGLASIVLNPGVPVDGLYRELNATMCTFEGDWSDYLDWSGQEAEPGDGHLVYGVPEAELTHARELAHQRGAGLLLATEHDWCWAPDPVADEAEMAVSP